MICLLHFENDNCPSCCIFGYKYYHNRYHATQWTICTVIETPVRLFYFEFLTIEKKRVHYLIQASSSC
ncbi:unnamed protein product [Adineta ricciae]|uniref:Uncharacterized protein n=1 Tax=Adineta ricciae TaxID=249248 RepID=A0A814RR07_ADIRI|nr:unnamed protein product [Adineta ricciae]